MYIAVWYAIFFSDDVKKRLLPIFFMISKIRKLFTLCIKNPIYVIPENKLCSLILNSYNFVSVSDLYIPRISLPIWLQQNSKTDPGNI